MVDSSSSQKAECSKLGETNVWPQCQHPMLSDIFTSHFLQCKDDIKTTIAQKYEEL